MACHGPISSCPPTLGQAFVISGSSVAQSEAASLLTLQNGSAVYECVGAVCIAISQDPVPVSLPSAHPGSCSPQWELLNTHQIAPDSGTATISPRFSPHHLRPLYPSCLVHQAVFPSLLGGSAHDGQFDSVGACGRDWPPLALPSVPCLDGSQTIWSCSSLSSA